MEYVNGKCVHALLSMVSGMNLGLKNIYIPHHCQFVKHALRSNNLGRLFFYDGEGEKIGFLR